MTLLRLLIYISDYALMGRSYVYEAYYIFFWVTLPL